MPAALSLFTVDSPLQPRSLKLRPEVHGNLSKCLTRGNFSLMGVLDERSEELRLFTNRFVSVGLPSCRKITYWPLNCPSNEVLMHRSGSSEGGHLAQMTWTVVRCQLGAPSTPTQSFLLTGLTRPIWLPVISSPFPKSSSSWGVVEMKHSGWDPALAANGAVGVCTGMTTLKGTEAKFISGIDFWWHLSHSGFKLLKGWGECNGAGRKSLMLAQV